MTSTMKKLKVKKRIENDEEDDEDAQVPSFITSVQGKKMLKNLALHLWSLATSHYQLLHFPFPLTHHLCLLALSPVSMIWSTRSWSRKTQHHTSWYWKRWIPLPWPWLGSLWCGRRKEWWIFIFILWRVFIRSKDEGRDILSLSRNGGIAWFTPLQCIPLSLQLSSIIWIIYLRRIGWKIFWWWRGGRGGG